MKLFVDDIRSAPDKSWILVRTVTEAIRAIARYEFEVISLDHDISHYQHLDESDTDQYVHACHETFAAVAYFLVAAYNMEKGHLLKKPKIIIHSSNITAGEEMIAIVKSGDFPEVEHSPMGQVMIDRAMKVVK